MDPFVLSRNAFHHYCSEYLNQHFPISNSDQPRKITLETLNKRYEYFLQTLDRLQTSVAQTMQHRNLNAMEKSEKDTLAVPSPTRKKSRKKHFHQSDKRRMPKVLITVSCAEHLTRQRPNIRWNSHF